MQKVVAMLEKNVQWIVLGLGAVYLLWMVWAYVLNSPVAVQVGGRVVEPGKVDEIVRAEKADYLEQRMKEPARVRIQPPQDPVKAFLTALQGSATFQGLPPIVFTPPTGKLDAPTTGQPVPGVQVPALAEIEQMDNLPDAPPAVDIKSRRGRSTVAIPDPSGTPDPQFTHLGPVRLTDRDWVSVRFTVRKEDIVKAFEAAKVPSPFMKTQFLRVELVREELNGDGEWGSETVVAPLKISALPPYPRATDRVGIAQYNEWSRNNTPEIVQPPFYVVTKGDYWYVPGEEDPAIAARQAMQANIPFDPNQYLDPRADLSGLTMEQRREVARARQAQRDAQRTTPRQPRQPSGPGGGEFGPGGPGGGGGRGPGQAYDPNRPGSFRQPRGEGEFGPRIGSEFGPGGIGGEFGPGGIGGEFGPGARHVGPQGTGAENFPIPNGEFDPRDESIRDFVGWAHDDTVQPGRTYRYKVRYRIKSPVFQTFNVMKEQAKAEQFDLLSPDSEWSEEVSIPALTSFYIAANFDGNTTRSIRFEVFRFQDGVLHSQAFPAGPGDIIGRRDPRGIDFDTGYSVVDIRRDLRSNESYVLVSDPTGRLFQRTFRSDQADPELRRLRQQRDAQAAAGG